LDAGAHSIETDLRASRDNIWMLCHDAHIGPGANLNSRNGRRRTIRRRLTVSRQMSASLQRVSVNGNPDPIRFPRQTAAHSAFCADFVARHFVCPREPFAMPSLRHLLLFLHAYASPASALHGKTAEQRENAGRVIIDLEVKSEPFESPPARAQLQRLVSVIDEFAMRGRCRLRSFDHRLVKFAHELLPEAETAVLVAGTAPVDPARLAQDANARHYCPDYRFLDRDQVRCLHKEGIRVLPWTVNKPAEWRRLIDWGVDGITTDDPARLIEWLSKNGTSQ
jgi:glycerophosphoryl diester phosphodiesterase